MKRIKKLFKKLNNNGSSVVMVIVALAFIGILVGALLTAVGYSYRLKLQDMNSRDNFYYVEQAMNEIYAGVGSQTVADMQEAYIYTVENMVEYDFNTKSYITKDKDDVEEMFRDRFVSNLNNNAFFSNPANLAAELEKFISNDSVVLDPTNLYIKRETDPTTNKVTKIIIKNVTLTRTQNYDKSVANGAYTQTISTDIEIGEPDFDVLFGGGEYDTANIFSYAMVADMGIEVKQPTVPLAIAGNIYAASDYYNKRYNDSMNGITDAGGNAITDADKNFESGRTYIYVNEDGTSETKSIDEYTHSSVTSKRYSESVSINTLYNAYTHGTGTTTAGIEDYYDGVNERSMYSGLYIDGSSVSLMSDMVIVPGSVAVMNDGGSLAIYGKSGKNATEAEVWIDNLILGGKSKKDVTETALGEQTTYTGASAVIRGNLYVKDDTELNANGSSLRINGSYYGYGDSTEKDERVFVPTVDEKNFQITLGTGENAVTQNRGHYNSSAIIINGQQSTLNLSQTNVIYLAGRSYIELSKKVDSDEVVSTITSEDASGNVTEEEVTSIVETYAFVPETDDLLSNDEDAKVSMRDYKTGESISIKTNQLAYIPIMYTGMPTAVKNADGVYMGYWIAELHTALQDSTLFESYFPESIFDNKIPCVVQEVSGKRYYYYDFETAYNMIVDNYTGEEKADFRSDYPSAQYYASAFIEDYVAELNDENSVISEFLTDITDYDELDFEPGNIILPSATTGSIYSSGAITTKSDTTFNIVRSDNWDTSSLSSLLTNVNYSYNNGLPFDIYETVANDAELNKYGNATALSNDLELEYNLVKWNLGHFKSSVDENVTRRNSTEISYIRDLCTNARFGEASITPINKFVNMSEITDSVSISPKLNSGDGGNGILDLGSGYSVWVDYNDVVVKARAGDEGRVRGLIITKGDVTFDENVTSFEGLIIAGGKVYITNNLKSMTASEAICKQILNECILSSNQNAKTVLKLFKGYEDAGADDVTPVDPDSSDEAKTIDNIDYSDVCRFSNWMKSVE